MLCESKVTLMRVRSLKQHSYQQKLISLTDFLSTYSTLGANIAAYGGPDWRFTTSRVGEDDGNFGAGVSRNSVTGSPIVPDSAIKVGKRVSLFHTNI